MGANREPEVFTIFLEPDVTVGDITITHASDELLQVEHTDICVPRSFAARVDRTRLPIIELEVEYIQHERFRLTSIRVIARDGDALDGDLRIPAASLVHEALERVSYHQVRLESAAMVADARLCFQDLDPQDDPVEIERIQIGDLFLYPVVMSLQDDRTHYEQSIAPRLRTHLREADHPLRGAVPHLWVALEYDRAKKAGEGTGRAVAERFGWKPATAANAIRRARKAGYLPPTDKGQARTFP